MNDINVNELLSQMRSLAALAQGQAPAPTGATGGEFANLLKNSIDSVNTQQQKAAAMTRAFETGEPGVDLAEVMIAMQKASISFQAMTQVRNKLVSAYQEVMSMNI